MQWGRGRKVGCRLALFWLGLARRFSLPMYDKTHNFLVLREWDLFFCCSRVDTLKDFLTSLLFFLFQTQKEPLDAGTVWKKWKKWKKERIKE
jgi:hypothetical protein